MKKLFLVLCLLLTPLTLSATDVVDPFPPQVDATLAPDVATLSHQAMAATCRDCDKVGRQVSELGMKTSAASVNIHEAIAINQVEGDDLNTLRGLVWSIDLVEATTHSEFVRVRKQLDFVRINQRNAATTGERFEVAAAYARAGDRLRQVRMELISVQEAVDAASEILKSRGL